MVNLVSPQTGAWLLLVMGAAVMFGWFINNSYLVQIHSTFAPMQFNTALGFLLCGGMLLTISKNRNTAAFVMAVITLLMGVLTLCQYIFEMDFGIDELLMDHSIITKTSHAGRMAPNTALCFSLSSLAILSVLLVNVEYKNKVVVFFGALIFSLGTVALIGYVGDIDPAYGWGNLTRMAIHTSIGFLIMGMGVITFIWIKNIDNTKNSVPDWLYIIILVVSFTITVSIWQALLISETNRQKYNVSQVSKHIKDLINSSISSQLLSLKRLSDRWEYNKRTSRIVWEKDALSYYEDYKVFQAIEWVDAESYVRWVIPLKGNENVVDINVELSEERIAALNYAKEHDSISISELIKLKQGGEYGFLVYFPLFIDGKFDGYIAAVYRLDKLFNQLLFDYIDSGHKFYFQHDDEIIYSSHIGIEKNRNTDHDIDVSIDDVSWTLSMIMPESSSSFTSTIVLVIGIMFSLLLGFATRLVSTVLRDKKRIESYVREVSDYASEAHASKMELQGVLDNAVDSIITIDEIGKIVSINPACRDMFGYDEDELLGNNIKMLMPSPYQEEHDGYLKKYLETGKKKIIGFDREVVGKHKNGNVFPIELSVSENTVKGHYAYTGFIRDISERKEIEDKLSLQKEYYEMLIHNLNVPAFILNTEHEVIIWNKACEQLTGILAENVLGTTEHWRGFYNEDRPLLADIVLDQSYDLINNFYEIEMENSFLEGGRHIQNWCPMPIKGKALYLAIDAGPVYDKKGKLVAIVEVLKDITKLKETQDSLEKRQQELERSNVELQQFAYVASHDLQEPLRMVASFTQLLSDRYKDKLDDQANEFIGFAVDGAKRMQSLIQDLLLLSKVDRKEIPFEECDANEIYTAALQNLQASIEETETEVSCDPLPVIHGDMTQLIQLFQNLIGNAVKYRDPEKNNKVHFSAEKGDNCWTFSVKDNGIGIEETFYKKVFVIFKRLHTKHEYSGTGIGLALCKKIVERHGGEISVESTFGEGSTFFFTLPFENIFPENEKETAR